ncbi:MAG: MspI family type II restriction endonuclease [Treponema sp.]|nr:MspI family type II restriction endonuclease [Treponema sp.]
MSQFSNSDKQEHGKNAKKVLAEILLECKKYSYIKEIIKEYRCGYAEYDNAQFYCNFAIIFQDSTKWIVNITTSFRSDRVKGNQWDSYNIKKIDPAISKSVLVYPDDLSQNDKDAFIAHNLKIINKIHYSAIDEIVSQKELFELIENYANGQLAVGIKKDVQGNNFELYISSILANGENLKKWITADPKLVGMHYDVFEKILRCFALDKKTVAKISATADKSVIGTLQTSGSPKTDIIVTVLALNNEVKLFTISCKKTSAKSVSVHQYTADAFADVLDKSNENLRSLLRKFQEAGNLRDFGIDNAELLKNELRPHLKKLVRWVIGGYGGSVRDNRQFADYILISDENNIHIHTLEEYTEMLLRPENESHFGTPFQWTFASGRKGKDIQLKCKILR